MERDKRQNKTCEPNNHPKNYQRCQLEPLEQAAIAARKAFQDCWVGACTDGAGHRPDKHLMDAFSARDAEWAARLKEAEDILREACDADDGALAVRARAWLDAQRDSTK